ncbi:hypothetical protein AAD018_012470 [Aestuariibius insulae]|uniref:hypothetical protein n=1 Tax=Aestuariibius insulae TaxID=2058287 RepID=UPI00345E3B19
MTVSLKSLLVAGLMLGLAACGSTGQTGLSGNAATSRGFDDDGRDRHNRTAEDNSEDGVEI